MIEFLKITKPMRCLSRFVFGCAITLSVFSQGAFAQAKPESLLPHSVGLSSAPTKAQGVGMRAASQAAMGQITVMPISYVEAAVIGIAIITNNNDNDGQPATFTGGSGSNMAAGG